jgi:hypothetical protein
VNVLAIDPGTHTGWCLGDTERAKDLERAGGARDAAKALQSGVEVFALNRGTSPGLRWIRYGAWLDRLPFAAGRGLVVYEAAQYAARFSSSAAADLVSGFTTRLEERAARHDWEIVPVAISTLKKWATGSGRAGKTAIADALRNRFGMYVADDNQADAVALWWYAYREVLHRPPVVPALSQDVGV